MDKSTILSLVAIAVSFTTAWFTIFHRGSIRMTHPSLIALLNGDEPSPNSPKVFLRTLLYTTGKRGQALEHMFIKVHQGRSSQTFPIWGSASSELEFGSGLFIGPEGHSAYHHFLLAHEDSAFRFTHGPTRGRPNSCNSSTSSSKKSKLPLSAIPRILPSSSHGAPISKNTARASTHAHQSRAPTPSVAPAMGGCSLSSPEMPVHNPDLCPEDRLSFGMEIENPHLPE